MYAFSPGMEPDGVQQGTDIEGDGVGDLSGRSVSMPDAITVAVGSPGNSGNGTDAGMARVYRWNGTGWVPKGRKFIGESNFNQSGSSVSMPNADTVAIGAPLNTGIAIRSGHTRVFDLCVTTSTQTVVNCGPYIWTQTGTNLYDVWSLPRYGNQCCRL